MRFRQIIFTLCSSMLVVACSDSNNSTDALYLEDLPRPELEFQTTDAPIDLGGISASFAADIPYGPY